MWYAPTVTVPAVTEPLTLDEAKAQTRVDGTADDTALTGMIAAARSYVEAYCGTPLISRTVTVKCDSFADFTAFPVVPLGSVSGVSYVDSASSTQTLSTSVYEVRSDGLAASLVLKPNQAWPAIQDGSRITVTAVVGYSAVPDAVRRALLLLIGQWFDNRTPLSSASRAAPEDSFIPELPNAVSALLTNFRSFAS